MKTFKQILSESISDAPKHLVEGIEDQHAQTVNDFAHAIADVKDPNTRRRLTAGFSDAANDFEDAYNNDDETLEYHHDDMRHYTDQALHHSGANEFHQTRLGAMEVNKHKDYNHLVGKIASCAHHADHEGMDFHIGRLAKAHARF
jgi:hypothetical protein